MNQRILLILLMFQLPACRRATVTATLLATDAKAETVVLDIQNARDVTVEPNTLPPLPEPLVGVTLDNIENLPGIVTSLAHLAQKHKPIARVVLDEHQVPAYYQEAIPAIHQHAFVMGEILDSQFVKDISVDEYVARAQAYVIAFAETVDLWEIGNEINGEWLLAKGENPLNVVAKMTGAYQVVRKAGKRAALTLYYNKDCWSDPAHEMFAWAKANVPTEMRAGLDVVLVSYYEDDCNGLQPDWTTVFANLRQLFPSAQLGIGECGTKFPQKKADYVKRYYGMQVPVKGYVGGYFWWYFYQDMVPDTTELFGVLLKAIGGNG